MQLRQLGNSKVSISPIIFGAWAIGGWMWGSSNEADAIEAIHAAIDCGITTIDTAPIYGMGYSEELVCKAIRERREKITIATKCGMRWDTSEGSNPWQQIDRQGNPITIRLNSKPASIATECERSLKRLGVDVIDLYQIHWPDLSTPIEDSWRAMAKLKEQGKVRAIGVSNYSLEQLAQAHAISPVDSLQPPYSLIRRGIENDVVPFCQKNNIAILAYSPLERGLLTGKVTKDREFPKNDHRREKPTFAPENRQLVLEALDKIRPIATRHQATIAQVIINCTIHRPGITAAIVGARNAAQATENAKSADWVLSKEEQEMVVQALNDEALQKVGALA